MINSRFPAGRFVRQLRAMRTELDWWEATYAQDSRVEPDRLRATRFGLRVGNLVDAKIALSGAIECLRDMPRLS